MQTEHKNHRTTPARALACAVCFLTPGTLFGQIGQPPRTVARVSLQQLKAGFSNPPQEAKLRCYWWWLNGNTNEATITHDLEEMKAKGFGGALLVDANGSDQGGNGNVPAGPTFGSPAWVALYTHALREADRLGLEITLNITSGWNLGGPDVQPQDASKLLTWSRTQVKPGAHVSLQLPAPETKNGFYRQIAVLAYPLHHGVELQSQPGRWPLATRAAAAETGFSMSRTTAMLSSGVPPQQATDTSVADTALNEVQNISAHVSADGKLDWDVPAGATDWEILRIGYTDSDARVSTSSGAWQGLAIDYLSKHAFNTYWDHTVEPLLTAAKPFHSLRYLATDSWELGGTNWTETFAAEFQKRRGYDPTPWLPVVAGRIIGDRDQSTRFLTDLRRTVGDLVSANHYDLFAERAAQHGLGVQAESGGPHGAPLDALETFRRSAVPQTEFWSINPHRAKDEERFFTKEAASAANIYGQRFVAQEGETSIGPQWSESLADDLKPSFDMGITEGMNRLVWHEFTSSPANTGLPGQEYFAGTHINPKITWWNAGGAFFTYLNRVQYIMQQGTAVDDVLYFYGDSVPAFVRLKADDPAHVLPGYDYDVADEDALLHTIRLQGNGFAGPSGVRWRVLAMPNSGRVSLRALQRIAALVHDGGTVVGLAPSSATGMATPAEATEFAALTKAMWGADCAAAAQHTYGKGTVVCTQDTHAALQQLKLPPDVEVTDGPALGAASTSPLDYVHRRIGAADVYFLRNGSSQISRHDLVFRAHASEVQLWDAVTGEVHRAASAEPLPDGRTRLHVELPPFGSEFIVFAAAAPAAPPILAEERPIAWPADLPWNVTFQPDRGAPAEPVTIHDLTSWTTWPQPGVRYFSGTATYSVEVDAPAFASGEHVLLRFANVHEVARVRINGKDAGTLWARPYQLRVDPYLRKGRNTIQIEVTNLWPNRIIGDLQPGATHRYTQTNITSYHADSPLLDSGLIGPVSWVIAQQSEK